MSDFTTTPNLGLYKPTYDADEDQWGNHLNSNADTLDAAISQVIVAGPTPPPLPRTGALWWNANDGNTYIWYGPDPSGSSQWVPAMFSGGVPLYPGGGPYVTVASTPIFNVRNYGAKGDGVTNDAPAVAATFAAAAAGGEIWFPAGNYVLATAISQSFTGSVTVRGSGPGVSMLSCAASGIAIAVTSNQNVAVRDLSIVSTAAGVANTGLSITSPDQSSRLWLDNLRLRGNTGGTTGWQTSISIVGPGCPRLKAIDILTLNGSGTGSGGATCIYFAGNSSSLNADNFTLSNCQLQGGLYGLQIGPYVEGVLITNAVILGNDYSVYVPNALNMLEITNCHCNPGICGVYANGVGFISIASTFFLRFATAPNFTAIDMEASGEVTIAGNNFFGNNAGTEIGVLVNNAVNTPVSIVGNTFTRIGTAAVRLSGSTSAALVTGNTAGSMHAGSVLVSDTTGNANQVVANNFNGASDIRTSNNNLIVAGNGIQYLGLGGPAHVLGFTWGTAGSGTTSLFVDGGAQGNVLTDQYAFTRSSYANDAAAATGGVPVGGLYRNGSALMVRMV